MVRGFLISREAKEATPALAGARRAEIAETVRIESFILDRAVRVEKSER